MSDEKDPTFTISQAPDRVKKVSVASMGGGRKPSPDEAAKGGAFIGTIGGKATGFRSGTRTTKEGEVQIDTCLTGEFSVDPADPKYQPQAASTCYLPDGFQQDVLDAIAPLDPISGKRKENGNEVTFLFDVYCIASSNASGYSYKMVPLIEQRTGQGGSILASLRAMAEKARVERAAAQDATKKVEHAGGKPK